MANVLSPVDVYTIVNDMSKQMFGSQAPQAVDTTTFVTIGEAMMRTSYTNTLDALSQVIGKTVVAIRNYTPKFGLIDMVDNEWGAITRKISYFWNGFQESKDFNTDINPAQLIDGGSIDPWKITKQYPLEMTFIGQKVLEKDVTTFRKQLRAAFHNESEFSAFFVGLATQVRNELNVKKEVENRALVLNHIGAVYNTGSSGMRVNLTAAYNAKFGTAYKSKELRTTYLKEFLSFFVETLKYASDMLTEYNNMFHLTPTRTDDAGNILTLPRHTEKRYQRLFLLSPLFISAEAQVLPYVFNGEYLKIEQAERVNYWQNPNDPGRVQVTPNQLDITTGQSKDGPAVDIPYVVAMMFDKDALAVAYHFDETLTTPVNARGSYYNTCYHFNKDYQDDLTENTILFYMADEDTGRAVITKQPTDQTVTAGTAATFSVTATGSGLKYQWYYKNPDGRVWEKGGTGASYQVSGTTDDMTGRQYYVDVSDASGGVVRSNMVTLTVN